MICKEIDPHRIRDLLKLFKRELPLKSNEWNQLLNSKKFHGKILYHADPNGLWIIEDFDDFYHLHGMFNDVESLRRVIAECPKKTYVSYPSFFTLYPYILNQNPTPAAHKNLKKGHSKEDRKAIFEKLKKHNPELYTSLFLNIISQSISDGSYVLEKDFLLVYSIKDSVYTGLYLWSEAPFLSLFEKISSVHATQNAKTFRAWIHPENKASIKLHELLGYQKEIRIHPHAQLDFGNGFRTIKILEETQSDVIVLSPEWEEKSITHLIKAFFTSAPLVILSKAEDALLFPLKSLRNGHFYLSTSGTTGERTWVEHSKTDFLAGISPESKSVMAFMNPSHAAFLEALWEVLLGGGSLFLARSLEDLRPSEVIAGPPQLLGHMLMFQKKYQTHLSSLKLFKVGMDRSHPEILKAAREKGIEIEQVYGSTETWRLETETQPKSSHLFKTKNASFYLENDCIKTSTPRLAKRIWKKDQWVKIKAPWTMSDSYQMSDDWISITGRKGNEIKSWGDKMDLEAIKTQLSHGPGVISISSKITPDLLGGDHLQIEIMVKNRDEYFSWVENQKNHKGISLSIKESHQVLKPKGT